MEPWYEVVLPRQEMREGRSLDPSEFAVHLEQVAAGRVPRFQGVTAALRPPARKI